MQSRAGVRRKRGGVNRCWGKESNKEAKKKGEDQEQTENEH